MQYLLAFIFPVISYFLQVFPRFFNRYFGVDVWTMLIEADIIRQNKHRIPSKKIANGFILDGYFEYPPIFLLLLSFLNKKMLERYQGFISPFFDALQNLMVFFIALQLTNDIKIALVAQLIYTLTPISALENSSLLARSLGYLMFSISFYSLLFFANSANPNLIFLFIGFIFATLTLLTHKFATQSLLFVCIFFTLIDKTPLYISVFIISVLGAIIISRKYYLKVIKGHIGNISFWVQNYKDRFAHQIYGNLPPNENPDLVGIIYKLLSKLAPITLLISNVWILAGAAIIFLNLPKTEILIKMGVWILFFYFLGIIILMVKRLIPIGEGYRYLEMTPVPTSILSSYLFFHFYNSPLKGQAISVLIFLLVSNAFVILFLQYKAVITDKNRSLTQNMKDIFLFINKLPQNPRVICIPHQITTMVIYNTKADVLVNFDTATLKYMNEFYPILKTDLFTLARKYNLSHLLFRESFAKLKDLKIKNPKIVYKSGDIALISLKK